MSKHVRELLEMGRADLVKTYNLDGQKQGRKKRKKKQRHHYVAPSLNGSSSCHRRAWWE